MVRIAICVFLAVLSTAYSDKEKTVADVNVHVSGKSGKIAICFKDQPKEDCLTFRFEDLGERDSNGNPVGQAGSVKHNFNNFAQLDFQLSDVVQDKFQDISVYTFKMTANITSVKATFMSQVYIFAESGSYVWGDEETEVKKGSVKFNIRVEGWKFCGEPGFTCNDGVGSYLDSKICIASKKGSGRKMERKQNKAGERPKGPKGKAKAEKLFFDGDSIVMPRGVGVQCTHHVSVFVSGGEMTVLVCKYGGNPYEDIIGNRVDLWPNVALSRLNNMTLFCQPFLLSDPSFSICLRRKNIVVCSS